MFLEAEPRVIGADGDDHHGPPTIPVGDSACQATYISRSTSPNASTVAPAAPWATRDAMSSLASAPCTSASVMRVAGWRGPNSVQPAPSGPIHVPAGATRPAPPVVSLL